MISLNIDLILSNFTIIIFIFGVNFYFILVAALLFYVKRRHTILKIYVTQKIYSYLLKYMQFKFLTSLKIDNLLKHNICYF